MSHLHFTVGKSEESSKATGYFSQASWKGDKKFEAIRHAMERGGLSNQEALDAARALPHSVDNLELCHFIAQCYWHAELREEAGELWEASLASALALIPSSFKGEINWVSFDNRPFLQVAHGALLSRMDREDAKSANTLCRQLLKWSPGDNLGVRMLQGDIAFMSGDYPRALKHYVTHGPEEPGSWYQAGRIAFRSGNFVEACTFMRRGIVANPYVAEGITGRTILNDHLYWHGTNKAAAEWAVAYLNEHRGRWEPDEADFVDWVFNSAAVLKERAIMAEMHEGLTYLELGAERSDILDRKYGFVAKMGDDVSHQLVRKVRGRYGVEYWPWERGGHNKQPIRERNPLPTN